MISAIQAEGKKRAHKISALQLPIITNYYQLGHTIRATDFSEKELNRLHQSLATTASVTHKKTTHHIGHLRIPLKSSGDELHGGTSVYSREGVRVYQAASVYGRVNA